MVVRVTEMLINDRIRPLFIRYLMIYSLFFLPFLLIHYQYIDDLDRTVNGVYGWSYESARLLTDVLMWGINFGQALLNSAPLLQVLAIILMAWASAQCFIHFKLQGALEGGCVLLLFLNPFFLENFSFRYDALSMTLANVLAVLGTRLFFSSGWKYKLMAFLLSTSILLIYQPSINVLMITVMVFPFIERKVLYIDRNYFLNVAKSASIIFMAGIVAIVATRIFISTNHGKALELLVPLSGEGIHSIFLHIVKFVNIVFSSLSTSALQSFLWFFFFCCMLMVFGSLRQKQSLYQGIFYFAFLLVLLLVLLVLAGGILVVLQSPIFPYRALVGVGGLLFTVALLAARLIKQQMLCQLLFGALTITLLPLITFTYIYANVLQNQEIFENRVVSTVTHTIANHSNENHLKYANLQKLYLIPGNIISVRTQRALREWPFLYGMMQNRLTNWWLTPILFKDAGITSSQLDIAVDKSGNKDYCSGQKLYTCSQYELTW